MKCVNCSAETAHIKIAIDGSFSCHNCGGWAESSGVKTDKILTRNATRVTEQAIQFEGDLITPYIVDKSTNQAVVNEEFINLYPNQAAQTYTQEELNSVGQPDLKPQIDIDDGTGIEFTGDSEDGIAEVIEHV